MKKLLVMLVVMAIAAPVFAADVDFAASADGTVTYTVNNGTIRGMGLNVDATAALTGVETDSFFDVFMDYAYMDPDNYELGQGDAIALQDAPGNDGVDMAAFCISMGNLEGEVTANEFSVAGPSGTEVTISINTLRGGVVNTDGVAMTTNLPITFTLDGDTPCLGDVNKDGKVSIADMSAIVAFLSPDYAETDPPYTADPTPEGLENADVNEDGKVSIADMSAIVAFLSPAYAETDPPYTYEGCMND